MSAAVVRAVVAIADAPEEKLRLASLETLGELVVRDVGLLVESEGLRVLLDTLSTGPFDLSPYLAMGFTWVMDGPSTRRFLRPGVDIEVSLICYECRVDENRSCCRASRIQSRVSRVTSKRTVFERAPKSLPTLPRAGQVRCSPPRCPC